MLASEIIAEYNEDRPNEVSDTRKLAYIKQCERFIYNEIISWHEWDDAMYNMIKKVLDELNAEKAEESDTPINYMGVNQDKYEDLDVPKYLDNYDITYTLFAEEPYTDLYFHYIDMKIANAQNDMKRYNNASTMYNNAYLTFQDWFNRTHLPKQQALLVGHHELL